MSWIRVIDDHGITVDAPLDTDIVTDVPQCYQVYDPRVVAVYPLVRHFYYGGPTC